MALEQLGYTERESQFLTVAAVHSGYFLRRQFAEERGKLVDVFVRKLLDRGHAEVITTVGHPQVLRIGPVILRGLGVHARDHLSRNFTGRLMLLDYMLAAGGRFLSETEKSDFFWSRGLEIAHIVRARVAVKVEPGNSAVLVFVDDGHVNFRRWLAAIEPVTNVFERTQVIFVTLDEAAVERARKDFDWAFGSIPEADMESYRRIEEQGLAGLSQDVLNRYREWRRRLEDAVRMVVFAGHVLPFRYRAPGERKG